MQINYNDLSLQQLHEIDDALEEFIFSQPAQKGDEPFAPSFRKNPKHFRAIIRELISFKKDLMSYFKNIYDDRWSLISYHTIPEKKFDSYDHYMYADEWMRQNQELTVIIEKHKKKSYELGLLALLLLGIAINTTSEDAQNKLLVQALKSAQLVNEVTKKRIAKQIEASLQLGEDRAAFEDRLKKVLVNQYRGRFISENEGLQSYLDAKKDGIESTEQKWNKTWNGSQTDTTEICGQVIGETKPFDEPYSNGLMGPLAHFLCKCDETYSPAEG